MATYSASSPYNGTGNWGQFLDIWPGKSVPAAVTDARYEIDPPYNLRPDLLAAKLYGDSNLWWVFAVRNPDVLIDPIFSFVAPTIIYIPTAATVKLSLGI